MRTFAIAAALVVTLAACSADSGEGSNSASGTMRQDRAGAEQGNQQQKSGGDKAGLTQAENLGRQTIRTSAMTVRVDDVAGAARAAVRVAESKGGFLESEQTANEKTTLTLRVPPEDFTATSDALAALGTVTDRTVATEDVTGDVADVDGRLKAARASTDRVRNLLRRANTISEITSLEAELNEREADLESLESRKRALAGKTSYAALTATFTKPVVAAAAPPKVSKRKGGFSDGLEAGWQVFTTTVTVLLIVLGALLPFAAAAALVGVPLYVLRRRRRKVSAPA